MLISTFIDVTSVYTSKASSSLISIFIMRI